MRSSSIVYLDYSKVKADMFKGYFTAMSGKRRLKGVKCTDHEGLFIFPNSDALCNRYGLALVDSYCKELGFDCAIVISSDDYVIETAKMLQTPSKILRMEQQEVLKIAKYVQFHSDFMGTLIDDSVRIISADSPALKTLIKSQIYPLEYILWQHVFHDNWQPCGEFALEESIIKENTMS